MKKHFWTYVFGSFLLCAVGYASESDCESHHCMAFIDAGSTKSYLHVYQYDENFEHFPVNIKEVMAVKVTPGLAQLKPDDIHTYFTRLLHDVPVSVPIYLYATAGMRMLSEQEQQQLYHNIHEWIGAHPQYSLRDARTLSGKEEGVFDWLAVNYQAILSGHDDYQGVMDMGGASVQIAFPTKDDATRSNTDFFSFEINGRSIGLFVHSFLGLGQTEVGRQLREISACYTQDYPFLNHFLGTGDWNECQQKVGFILELHEVSQAVLPTLLTHPVKKWYAMGALSALASNPILGFEAHQFSVHQLSSVARQKFCETNWSTLYNSDPNNAYLNISCLASAYFHLLLSKGYGFDENQIVNYDASAALSESWTLGALIANTSELKTIN